RPPAAGLDAPGARLAFFEAVCEALIAACSSNLGAAAVPGILLIEDAHCADTASLDLLTFLVRRLHGQRALLLLTWRESYARVNPSLQRRRAAARKGATGATLRLTRLDLTTVRELVELTGLVGESDAGGAAALCARMYQETEGVPFLLME